MEVLKRTRQSLWDETLFFGTELLREKDPPLNFVTISIATGLSRGTKSLPGTAMSSGAKGLIGRTLSSAERVLWEKYNKPSRNLFQALSAFEKNGVGRKVVCPNCIRSRRSELTADVPDAFPLGEEGIRGLLLHSNLNEASGGTKFNLR